MQTVASLAKRLDMSADDAVETLRKLSFDIGGVETNIDDDQCDLLIDVDEDPSVLDGLLQEIKKKEDIERKKAERVEKAEAKKKAAAAKKPAAAEKKAAAEAKKVEAADKKAAAAIAKAKAAE
ncbi:MAG: hypothetical protein L3K26_09680, partial [Candidatus Hydrogenedentes bacterium]|nr:hypothetical protein [Candidatus Hydrogenedentota bacterium]